MSGNSQPHIGRHPRVWLQRPFVLHPLLVSAPVILTFTYDNKNMAHWYRALYPIALSAIPALVLMLLLQVLLKNPRKAGIITTLVMLVFHTHHHLASDYVWPAVAVLSVLFALWPGKLDAGTTFFNIFVIGAIGFTAWPLVQFNRTEPKVAVKADYLESLPFEPKATGEPPDVYYIVLDGYGREDVLSEYYGIEEGLSATLRDKGFYVADESHSNYAQTALSFAATLNMDFIPNLLDIKSKKSMYRLPLGELIANNRVVAGFREAGYEIVTYPSEYSLTHLSGPDVSRRPLLYFTEFEYILMNDTALLPLMRQLGQPQSRVSHAIRRNHLEWVLDDLALGRQRSGPTFTYAHLVIPHPPFLFKPDGSYRTSRATATFADGNSWIKKSKRYKEKYDAGYRDQTLYLDSKLTQVVEGILSNSEKPPVIVIQGDHGPALKLDWGSKAKTDVWERHGILNAYYFPDGDYSRLRPNITPVNTWRVVFNQFFGTDLAELPDKSWFNIWSGPYDYRYEVTSELAMREAARDSGTNAPVDDTTANSASSPGGAPTLPDGSASPAVH